MKKIFTLVLLVPFFVYASDQKKSEHTQIIDIKYLQQAQREAEAEALKKMEKV